MTDNLTDSQITSQNINNQIEVIEKPASKSKHKKHHSKHSGKSEHKSRKQSNSTNDEIEVICNVGSQDETITIEIGEEPTPKSSTLSNNSEQNSSKTENDEKVLDEKSSDSIKKKRKDSILSKQSDSKNEQLDSTLSENNSTLSESSGSTRSKKSKASSKLSEMKDDSSHESNSSKKKGKSGKKEQEPENKSSEPGVLTGVVESTSSTALSQMQVESWHTKDVSSIADLQKNSKIESIKKRKENQSSSEISSDLLGSLSGDATPDDANLSNNERDQWKPKLVNAVNNVKQAPGSRSNFMSSSDFTDPSKITSKGAKQGKNNKKAKNFVINSESSSTRSNSPKESETDNIYDSDGSKGNNEPLPSPVQKRYNQKVDAVYSTQPLVSPAKGRGLRVRKRPSDKEPEMGRLTLPTEGEFQPDSEISDLGVEFDTYKTKFAKVASKEGNEIKRRRKPISTVDDNSSIADDNSFANSSNLFTRGVDINQSSSIPSEMMETNQESSNLFSIEEGDSENQGAFLLQFQKNAELLSSSSASEKEEEEVHEDKFVSKKGITLFMLSSSDNDEEEQSAASEEENEIMPQSSVYFSSETVDSEGEQKKKSESRNKFNGEMIAYLTVIEAIGLPTFSLMSKDPYCTVNIKGKRDVQNTKVMINNASPIWNSQFKFILKNNKDVFAFNIKYADKFAGDTDVAYAEFRPDGLKIGRVLEKTIPLRLYDNDGIPLYQPNPQLHFSLLLRPKPMPIRPVDVSPRPTPKSPGTASFVSRGISDIENNYENEINSTITVIEARNLEIPSNGVKKIEPFCTINVIGRNDLKRTKSVSGTTSPIWNKQFKYVLENNQVTLLFNIVLEDKALGDLRIAYAKVPINNCAFNQFNNMWVLLQSIASPKREKINSILDPSASYLLQANDTHEEEDENSGELHISIVLEPKVTDIPFSPRPAPGTPNSSEVQVFGETPAQTPKFHSSSSLSTNNSEVIEEEEEDKDDNNDVSKSPSILSYSDNKEKFRSDALDPLDDISTLSESAHSHTSTSSSKRKGKNNDSENNINEEANQEHESGENQSDE